MEDYITEQWNLVLLLQEEAADASDNKTKEAIYQQIETLVSEILAYEEEVPDGRYNQELCYAATNPTAANFN